MKTALNRQDEALVIAERGRNRTSAESHLERQHSKQPSKGRQHRAEDFSPINIDQITDIVDRQRASVLYFSIAAGFLYSWLIVPTRGVIKFHSTSLYEDMEPSGGNSLDRIPHGSGLLERLVFAVRDSLGAELSPCATINEDQYPDDTLSDRTGNCFDKVMHIIYNSSAFLSI